MTADATVFDMCTAIALYMCIIIIIIMFIIFMWVAFNTSYNLATSQ